MDESRLVRTRRRAVRAWLLAAALTALWVALTTPLFVHVWLYWLAFCGAVGSLVVIVYGVIHFRHTGRQTAMAAPIAISVGLTQALGALADYAFKNVPMPEAAMRGVMDIPVPSLSTYIAMVLALAVGIVAYTAIDR